MKECPYSGDIVAILRRFEDRSDRTVALVGRFQGFEDLPA